MITALRETHINATRGYGLGDDVVTELSAHTAGELFRICQKEYGRCISKMYRDTETGTHAVGWVFQKLRGYEDDPSEKYMHEVWVETLEKPDQLVSYPHYLD